MLQIIKNIHKFIFEFIFEFTSGLKIVWITIFLKYPCNKCIVKSCCTEKCNDLLLYINIKKLKIFAWSIVFGTCVFITTIITTIFL